MSDISYCQCPSHQLGEANRPVSRVRRRKLQRGGQGVDGVVQLLPCDDIDPAGFDKIIRGFAQKFEIVAYAGERAFFEGGSLNNLAATAGQSKQVPGEVPTVYGRDVRWLQWSQIAGVVPVVEMASNQFQLAHCAERRLQPVKGIQGSQVAKVVRGQRRQQIQPDIGWRGAVCDDRPGVLLEIIGGQGVVRRGDECLKEAPGSASDQAQGPRI